MPGTLYMLVLQTLARSEPIHGYGIAQEIQTLSDDVLQVEEGSLYPALQRMLVKGWITSEWQQVKGRRRARFYRLTASGRSQLTVELAEFERIVRATELVIQTT
ncbi:PadR family transcriptional regulator [Gemmatimonadota bacterium]